MIVYIIFNSHAYPLYRFFFFFNDTATTEIYTLSLHDALPICRKRKVLHRVARFGMLLSRQEREPRCDRSEEHTSELQSRRDLVCRLLLEKKKKHEYNKPFQKQHINHDKK